MKDLMKYLKNPYMKEIYPDEISREVLEVFQIDKCQGEYFDLSQNRFIVKVLLLMNL